MTRNDIRRVNEHQKLYYEARYNAFNKGEANLSKAGRSTNFFYRLRKRFHDLDRSVGARSAVEDLHRDWLGDLSGRSVLDLGCFSGNALSTLLAEKADVYRGVDLSEQAVEELNRQLAMLNSRDARAIALDILDNEFPSEFFDVVYARSVLHHFRDLDLICHELKRILKPGGIVITYDPLQTEPINKLVRWLYRPLQSDRDWEWPFTRSSIRTLQSHFETVDMMGVWGLAKFAFPLSMLPFGRSPAIAVGSLGSRIDRTKTRKPGFFFYQCWHATILFRKTCVSMT